MIRIISRLNTTSNIIGFSRKYSRWENEIPMDDDVIIEVQNNKAINLLNQSYKRSDTVLLPKISNPKLYRIAVKPVQIASFKKLEFLGDAYLDFVVSVQLLHSYPNSQKRDLAEMLYDSTNNDNLRKLCKKEKLLNDTTNIPEDSKVYADVFEAYFGAVSYESGISSHFGQMYHDIRNKWFETSKYMAHNIKYLNGLESQDYDSNRRLTQLRNTTTEDLRILFNYKPDDYESKFTAERYILLGTYVLKYFLTKFYNDNLNKPVSELASMRNARLEEKKVNYLADKLLDRPSFSQFYSLFNRNKSRSLIAPSVSHIKLYLGYIAITHFPNSDKKSNKLFQIGWQTCESLIYDLYFKDMQKLHYNRLLKNKYKLLVDPAIIEEYK